MRMTARLLPLAAVFPVLLAAALPVQAAAYAATASISNIRYTLTDLDLTDNVSPYLQIAGTIGYPSPSLRVHTWDLDSGQTQSGNRDLAFFDTQTVGFDTVTTGPKGKHLQASASIAGDSLDTFAITTTAAAEGRGRGNVFADISQYRYFVLSPNTRLSISFDVNIDATQSDPSLQGSAEAYAYVSVDNQNAWFKHAVSEPGSPGGEAGAHTFTALVESRNWEHPVNTMQWIGTSAEVTQALPVPEPHTYAMLALGLGLIGWRRARRA